MAQSEVAAPPSLVVNGYKIEGTYGKFNVNVFRVNKNRVAPFHEVLDIDTEIVLEAGFIEAYTVGDNSNILPTDTMKNFLYVVAQKGEYESVEDFGIAGVRAFLAEHSYLHKATLILSRNIWDRLTVAGQDHPHAFKGVGPEKEVARVIGTRGGDIKVYSTIYGMKLLKTTQSGFEGFYVDRYTTLPPTQDRLFATAVEATYEYSDLPEGKFQAIRERVRRCFIEEFSGPPPKGAYSKSVQETECEMALRALKEIPNLTRFEMVLPNIHHFKFNLAQFSLPNDNEVFFRNEGASGKIHCIVTRV
uniref:Uricase n=1 Tax=Nephromyces sp. MMRI TaxID=2496275 RepID=A0A3S5HLX1_9APIC|nr:uricase [Nephromyces sp. MMRI]